MLKIKHRKTFSLKKEEAERKWYILNAEGKTLGRIATRVADLLRGKGKVVFTTHVDCGDFVVITNADKLKVTGQKDKDKMYYSHSQYGGGLKETSLEDQLKKDSRKVILAAVKGMLPKSRLARKQLTKCKVFKGAEHDHVAQNPATLEL